LNIRKTGNEGQFAGRHTLWEGKNMKIMVWIPLFLLVITGSSLFAATPRDTLVMASKLDDVITLDPAEIFEFTGAELAANMYDRLIGYDVGDVSKIHGVVAESWDISDDGRTYSFRIREDMKFASGNKLTAEDVVFSLQRVIKLNKSPAFLFSQFGFTPANMTERIVKTGDYSVRLIIDKPYAPTFFLYCLTSTPGSIVDKLEVLKHEEHSDMGYGWLKTHSAGSGPFMLTNWKPSEILIMAGNEHFHGKKPAMKRIIVRHISESATQRLLLEKGDVDMARNIQPDDLKGLAGIPDIRIRKKAKGAVYYLGLNQKNQYLKIPQVRQALKYLIDYAGMESTLLSGKAVVHQAFLPKGFLGALEETPFSLNVEKAKGLLKEAGLEKGFSVTMDTRNTEPSTSMALAIQATFALADIKLEIIPGEGKQVLTKYRERTHDIFIGRWGPDYMDPHTNADTFARNPDNSDAGESKTMAWRNAWDIPEMTRKVDAAVLEKDAKKRAQMYIDIQREHQRSAPFVIMFQEIEILAERSNVSGFILGPSFDSNFYRFITK
jgi:peptide/nickel transport system substrate-binding protein